MIYIGIDPGMDGGLAAVGSKFIDIKPMPTISGSDKGTKRMLDVDGIIKWIYKVTAKELGITEVSGSIDTRSTIKMVVLEKVHSMPGQGVASMFSFGQTYGMLQGIIRTLQLPMVLVPPQTWKKVILEGTQKDKGAAIQYNRQLYPTISLHATERCTTDHDGMAEALCMADYGRRIFPCV